MTDAKDYHLLIEHIISFLKHETKKRNFKKAILGLSGGIDSAVVAAIAQAAYIKDAPSTSCMIPIQKIHQAIDMPVLCAIMPSLSSSQQNIKDAIEVACFLNLPYTIISLEDFENSFKKLHPTLDQEHPLRKGNACARFRMTLLYDIAFAQNRIVLGTSNKSERLLGYGTIYGDLASGINPIGNIYKSDIFILAQLLKLPQHIINKAPSADLYEGQTDEAELGYSYHEIDHILYDWIDQQLDKQALQQKHNPKAVDMVMQRHHTTAFKREPIPMAEGF